MSTPTARETLRLDAGWRFYLGDIDSSAPNTHLDAYMANKAGYPHGAARPNFDDSDWRQVDLPHDWSVEGSFDRSNHVDAGFLPRGVGWYRRYFQLEESDRGKHLALQFDGIATHCTVYVNGHLLRRNFCGYTPFTIDISDIANFGEKLNVISVRVDATYMEGWWYEGAGIYRHVWLIRTSPTYLCTSGFHVKPVKMDAKTWLLEIRAPVHNKTDHAVPCEAISTLFDPNGSKIKERSNSFESRPHSSVMAFHVISIDNPALWSCESPALYSLRTELRSEGKTLDDRSIRFGYRTIRFDPDHGFFLNDKPVRLKGTCNHQDHAGVGVAVPDSIHEFRIRRLLDMGTNAYRCAHNPPAPELLDACDRLGMLVMDENRNFGSSPEHLAQLRTMVFRDRNHPSVILWSICNEEAIQGEPVSANIARAMIRKVESIDLTRPVTAAVSGGLLNDNCIASEIPIMGMNYQLHLHEPYHAKHPDKPILAAETNCALSTRGVYETDPKRFVFGSYDTEKAFWGNTARQTWRALRSREYVAGLFVWTGFDYRGEPSPHEWPCINSHWGILDTCGFAKDTFYLHKAWFTTEPFVHLLPHWNWPGKEGTPIKVAAYTNCDSVEFFLNDQSLGRKQVDPVEMSEWSVPYQPGKLSAVAYREGAVAAECAIQTTGPAVELGLEIHPSFNTSNISSDEAAAIPVTAFALDTQRRRVPTANDFVTFTLTGPAKILGVGNGDPTCHEPDKASSRSLFNGLAQVILQRTNVPGQVILTASAEGLKSAELILDLPPADAQPALPPAKMRHFVSNWRMSAITKDRPDPRQEVAASDMNSWERIDPAAGPQKAWQSAAGFALYLAEFTPPKYLHSTGGWIVFPQILGQATIYLYGQPVPGRQTAPTGPLRIPFKPTAQKVKVAVILQSDSAPAGISRAVEILAG